MERWMSFLLAGLLLLGLCASAGEASPVGDWYGGILWPDVFTLPLRLTIRADGTYMEDYLFREEPSANASEGTWEMKDGVVLLSDMEDMPLTLDGDELRFAGDDANANFNRPNCSYAPAEPVKAASAGELAGRWECDFYSFLGAMWDGARLMGETGDRAAASIEDGSIMLPGFLADGEAWPLTFKDGALLYETDPEIEGITGIRAQLLEDGRLALTVDWGGVVAFIFYMSRG